MYYLLSEKLNRKKIMAAGKIFIYMIVLFVLNNCNSKCNDYCQSKYSETANNFLDTNVKIGNVIEFVSTIIEGDIIKAEKKFKKNIQMWKVNVHMPSGGFVEMEISASEKKILQIEADEGPFEYEIAPGEGIVSFNSAKKNAEDHSGQKILKWVLKQNKEKYEYNFWVFTKSGKAQVKIDADSGDLILNNKKKK